MRKIMFIAALSCAVALSACGGGSGNPGTPENGNNSPQAVVPQQPASQPAAQPATQPATQPASDPATQPASQPTTQPVTQQTSNPNQGGTQTPVANQIPINVKQLRPGISTS